MAVLNTFSRSRPHARFTLADGRSLDLRAVLPAFTNPFHSTIRVEPRVFNGSRPDAVQVRDLHIAYAGNYDAIMSDFLDARVEQTLSAQGGSFIVARSSRADLQGLVLWRGPHHEVAAWLPIPAESEGIAPLDQLSGLTFADSPTGLVVTANSPDYKVSVVSIGMDLDNIGAFTFFPSEEALPRIPSWTGTNTPVGELWVSEVRDTDDSPVRYVFTLANKSVVAQFQPAYGATKPFTSQLNSISNLAEMSLS
jgi:hypothetical protein